VLAIVITVEAVKDAILFVKIDYKELSNLDKINPLNEVTQIKDIIEGNVETVRYRYSDDDLMAELRFRLAKLLAFYVMKQSEEQNKT